MRWHNKKQKLLRYIILLLFIFHVLTVSSLAQDTTNDSKDETTKENTDTPTTNPNTDDDQPEDESVTTNDITKKKSGDTPQDEQPEESTTVTTITSTKYSQNYVKYAAGLSTVSEQEKHPLLIESEKNDDLLQITITDHDGALVQDATVTVFGDYYQPSDGIVIVPIPPKLDTNHVLIKATPNDNGYATSYSYVALDETEQEEKISLTSYQQGYMFNLFQFLHDVIPW